MQKSQNSKTWENVDEYIYDIELGEDYLKNIYKIQAIEKRHINLTISKYNSSYQQEVTINKLKYKQQSGRRHWQDI